jgi:hypothetical protein
MSGQLPPIDQDLRAHLARRSAGRLPEGLADQVLQAVDAAPVKPRHSWRAFSPRSGRAAPRTLLAGASVAAVLLLAAALVVVPRFQVTPAASGLAGYPADRALTTAELAALMAGPALPTNTALVAKVTINPTTYVCPNDRYKTLGMVEGMGAQVCVMGTYNAFDAYDSKTTATFAFRYLAPGYLGLLGAIVSPPELGAGSTSKLAFRASEQWPNEQSGKPFLVEGWLGSSAPPQSVGSYAIGCTQPLFGAGDPLDPAGPDNTCKTTWLAGDASTVPSWEITGAKLGVSVQGGHEVGAGGARFYDSIPSDSPVKGVYVVRSQASAVSCDLPSCGDWVVMAKVADVSLPQATATPPASLAGYPAGRALTAAELAALMARPAMLPNAPLVASVTIDANTDVCPMDRYPTIGVVEGMGAQVCVMGAGVSTYLSTPKAAGVFAFRYLGPGVLGFIGEITPAPAQMAFRVADEWPLQGKTFLVDGWLGAEGLMESCARPPTSGEILLPDGEDCPYDDWLSDDSTAPGIQADHEYSPPSPLPSYDPLSLRGNARHVGAGGMRIIDSVDHAAPVHGVYVVRSVTEACAGDPPQSSRGCGAWRVFAKLADVSAPVATPVPTPSPTLPAATPPAGYPVDRALTAAELAAVMAGPALPANTTLVAAVTIDSSESGAPGCVPTIDSGTIGLVHGMPTRMCVFGGGFSPARVPGIFAFRYLGPGALYLMAQITPASSSRLAFHATEAWPWTISGDTTFLVGGYLVREPAGSRITDTPTGPMPASSLTPQPVQVDDTAGIDSTDPSRYGVFLVRCLPVYTPTDSKGSHGDGFAYHVIAQVGDIALPGASATPPPSPTPTTAPPETPIPFPTVSPVAAPTGLMGSGNRPLTAAEFATLWAADPAHLAGRIAIVKGPVPAGFRCRPTVIYESSPSRTCYANVVDGQIAPEGYWAIRVGSDGMLSAVGELSTPSNGFVHSLPSAMAAWKETGGGSRLFLVDAWIGGMAADACDVMGQPCYEVSWLAPTSENTGLGSTPDHPQLEVQPGAYHMFGPGNVGGGPAIQGIFLVQGNSGAGMVLARLEVGIP